MTISQEVYDQAMEVATGVVRQVARAFPSYGWEDLTQDASLWVLSHKRKASEYMTHEDPRQGQRLLATALRNELRGKALRDKAYREGFKVYDNAFYTLAQLKEELLPSVFNVENWLTPPQQTEGARGSTPPNERGNWLASLADVAGAYRRLSEAERVLLLMYYEQGLSLREIAEELGQEESAVESRFDRAIKRILHLLGGERPERCSPDCECKGTPAGGRRVTSNAAARAMTDREINGE